MTLTNGKEEERIVYDAHILLFKRIFICWFFYFHSAVLLKKVAFTVIEITVCVMCLQNI